uniref:Uncharacterized protein n=1 Tax=Arundo donax TaxID=35708 RepID=A0A0A9CMT8_ARUDO
MLLNHIFLPRLSSHLTAGIGPIIVLTPSSVHSSFMPSLAALSSAMALSLVRNVDCHPRPIGEDGSSPSPKTLVYINPSFSSFSTNSGNFSFILL